MLQIRWENHGLVAGLARQLDTEVPRVECNESEFEVLRSDVFSVKVCETIDGVAEGAGVADLVPCEGCQAGCAGLEVSGNCTKSGT